MRTVRLPSGVAVPALGQGTWKMGESRARSAAEVSALKLGLDLGLTLIDTAEMYASGGAEEVVREAIVGRRDAVFLVSKVLPSNATRVGTVRACEASLRRLGTDRIDLYLLHWRGSVPLAETVDAMETLKAQKKILQWGVSNFDVSDMADLAKVKSGDAVAANQVLYNLQRRGIDFELAPRLAAQRIPIMAYSPVGQGELTGDSRLSAIARRHDATAAQIALAWTLRDPNVISIPKAASAEHVRDNRTAADILLTEADLAELDAVFPPPNRQRPLEMI